MKYFSNCSNQHESGGGYNKVATSCQRPTDFPSASRTDRSPLAISTAGTSNTLYVEQIPGTFNANTDLAMIVNTSAVRGLHASDLI
jgi:hypothetical protein